LLQPRCGPIRAATFGLEADRGGPRGRDTTAVIGCQLKEGQLPQEPQDQRRDQRREDQDQYYIAYTASVI
jgi:hypothetical protein